MATTKTQSFNNKIKALKDFHSRLISGVGGIPSSGDIQATLKYFCNTLKSILKETSSIPNESYGARQKDITLRINLFPNFHYEELFYILIGLCEFIGKLNNQSSVCEVILKTFNVLIPFLEFDNLDMLPLIVTSCINFFPSSQHTAIIELLCTAVIPFVYTWNEESESYAIESVPAILQIVFQHIDKSEYHSWVVESFMSKKRDLWKDLLLLIAYGSIESRLPATYLLFYYWPELCPVMFQSSQVRFPTKYHHEAWKAILCERTDCPNKASKTVAMKMTYEPQHALIYGNKVPPLYVCLDCFDALSRQRIVNLHDVILPIKKMKTSCESKTCRSKNNNAFITCFSSECTSLNGHKPIRFCEGCHIQKHLGAQSKKHIYQLPLPDIWDCSMEIQPCMVEAIVSLSKETLPRWRQQLGTTEESNNNLEPPGATKCNMDPGSPSMLGVIKSFASFQDNDIPLSGKYNDDDHKIISLYAAFIIGEKCPPKPNTNIEILSRIVSGLFNWFYDTVFTVCGGFGPDSLDEFIEKIKKDYLLKWIQQVVENNLEVMLIVLLPYPVEYGKVGSCWDSLCDRTAQVKQGLHKISSLIPYDIITFETWDYIIPFWLETLRTEIPESDYPELEILMKKIFDPHAGPFPFLPAKLYQFATQRFTNTPVAVQDQILCWLDILTKMKVQIPMKELLTMFSIGIKSMHDPIPLVDVMSSETSRPSLIHQEESLSISGSDTGPANVNHCGQSQTDDIDPDGPPTGAMSGTTSLSNSESFSMLSCLCIMVKTINIQLKMNDPHGHGNMSQQTPNLTLGLLTDMLLLCWNTDTCKCKHLSESNSVPNRTSTSGEAVSQDSCITCQNVLVWHQLAADILHHIVPIHPISLPDTNLTIESMAINKKTRNKFSKDNTAESDPGQDKKLDDTKEEADTESQEFDISDLSVDLKLLYLLVRELHRHHNDPEIIHSILLSVTYLMRHAELLKTDANTIEKKFKYINHLMENMLIPALWDLMCTEFSYLAELSVPLLLYCFTIPSGADQFWHILEKEFTSEDWRIRFDAVEKLTILARQVDDSMFGENQAVMTSLANAFSNLIGSLDDMNSAVAARTVFYLESIKDKSLNCIVKCLEFQFDSVIADRTLILLRIYQLSWALPGRAIFSWDFFINRFGIFSIEAQIGNNLDTDINNVTDLNNQKGVSDFFRLQFERARLAVARTDSIRSISSTASSNPLYRRACSVPLHQSAGVALPSLHSTVQPLNLAVTAKGGFKLTPSHDPKPYEDANDKHYTRQSSAPQFNLGRRKSKPLLTGLGGLNVAEYTDPNNRFLTNIQEALDLEGSSRDTLHQWVTLLLKFMASVDMQSSKDELKDKKALSKVQRHLALLLGYTDQSFNIPPYKLRNSTVFHAFISNVAKVLDCNFSMGNSILHQTLVVLQFCASPQRYASDSQPPTFSLWLLEPQTRIHWLNVLLVVLYKYEYNASGAGSGVVGGFRAIVDYLVRISINTVENHLHVCKRMDEGYSPPTPHLPRPRAKTVGLLDDTSNFSMDVDPVMENDMAQSMNGALNESLNISRASRSATVHYTKKDKELEILSSRFTSPVIKKKVARQYRGRSIASPNINVSGVAANASSVAEEDTALFSGPVEPEPSGVSHETPAKEVILSPITVSSKDKNIKTSSSNLQPVIEENSDFKEESNPTNILSHVDNKIAEQLSQFFMDIDNNKRPGSIALSEGQASHLKEATIIEDKEKSEDEMEPFDDKPNYRQRKARKSGLTSVEIQKILDIKDDPGRRRSRRSEIPTTDTGLNSTAGSSNSCAKQQFYHRHVESFMVERCTKCHAILEHYDEETLGLAIVCFGAYVHREPALAAPYLYDMLIVSAKIASHNLYSWKNNLHNVVVPNNVVSCARQFLRCTFYNLFPNGLFVQLFQTEIENNECFMKCMVSVLIDFEDHLNIFQPVQQVLEGLNKKKVISPENLPIVIDNLAAYLEALPASIEDSKVNHMLGTWWTNIAPQFDIFLRKLPNNLQPNTDVEPILRIIIIIIRSNMISSCKSLMDTFAFLLKFIVENCKFSLHPILELCSMTNRLYKEKGKSLLTKCLIEELHLAIKFKIYIPDKNLLLLIQFVLMDAGGTVEPNKICEGLTNLFNPATYHILNTGAAELMRVHLHDCITFISDVHTVHKVKQNQKLSGSQSMHEDTLGSHLKSAIAQYVALELSPSSSSKVTYNVISMSGADSKDSPILQFMPWIKSIPPATQQGPREFILCVERVRTLNWLLLGSMIHTCVTSNNTGITCQPIPLGFKKSIADLVKVILSGFPDQQKQSVIVMSSLYHAFVLCQLWTMYCETAASLHSVNSGQYQEAVKTAMDFWMNILPTILHLLTISDDFVVVNGHLLTIMEELIECRSQTVAKVISLWTPILHGRNKQLPGNLQKRLQKCVEWEPPEPESLVSSNSLFIKWLKKHVFVLGRNEDQHSAATHIFVQ